jgi:hypothetical protein
METRPAVHDGHIDRVATQRVIARLIWVALDNLDHVAIVIHIYGRGAGDRGGVRAGDHRHRSVLTQLA